MTKHTFSATLVERHRLTKPHSSKAVWHLAFEIADDDFVYEAGDSLGVVAENDPKEIEAIYTFFKTKGSVLIGDKGELSDILLRKVDLTKIPLKLVKLVESHIDDAQKEKLQHFCTTHSARGSLLLPVSAFLANFGTKALTLESLISNLQPILPRLYSISSSPKVNPKRVELMVAEVTHTVHGVERHGLCSHFLSRRAQCLEVPLKVSLHKADHFRVPKDPKAPLIMIGPGTGVAPFRAFIQELFHSHQTPPPVWLFYGDRNRSSDFLHEEFFLNHEKSGWLHLDVAFSRDIEDKGYVQHKMWKQRAKVAQWIAQKNACVYICGDAQAMAKDVEDTLQNILVDQNVVSSKEEALKYLQEMRKSGRYCKDVY